MADVVVKQHMPPGGHRRHHHPGAPYATPEDRCRGPNASNPARGRTLPGQERPSNGRPDASQRRPGSMLCPVGLPGALSVDILALLLYWPTYAPIIVRLTSDTHVAYWQWRPELPLNVWATQCALLFCSQCLSLKKSKDSFCERGKPLYGKLNYKHIKRRTVMIWFLIWCRQAMAMTRSTVMGPWFVMCWDYASVVMHLCVFVTSVME